jgi:glycerate kinase
MGGMPPTVLVATDTFKGSLSAAGATRAIARGLTAGWPGARIDACPISDGGEGFVEAMVQAAGGAMERLPTTNALGDPIMAAYGVLDGGATVAVELSSAAGLAQLPPTRRQPLLTTTHGVGTLIADAHARHGFKRLLLALGGSATVDGGAGLLTALGVRFLDAAGDPIPLGGGGLGHLATLDVSGLAPWLHGVAVQLAVDVTNPLVGDRGAARVYGPQKGADAAMVEALERHLAHYADVLAAATGTRVHDLPGSGSAGGVPAGLVALAGATMVSGFALVAEAVGLDARLGAADWVVTGEGQLDHSSFEGKVVGRLAARCRERGVPLIAVVGNVDSVGEAMLDEVGGTAFSLVSGPMTTEAAMANAERLLERSGRALGTLLRGTARARAHPSP